MSRRTCINSHVIGADKVNHVIRFVVDSGADFSRADFPGKTKIDVAVLDNGQQVKVDEPFLAYITRGKGLANNEPVEDGDLIRGDSIKFEATDNVQLIVVHAQ